MADEIPMPPVAAVHAYMRAAGWEVKEPGGPAGCIWVKDGRRIGVPYTDGDAVLIPGVVNRLADAEGRKPGDVARAIIAVYGGAVKPCGCGPLEPCALHRDGGDLQDWEARAVAAEAKLATAEAKLSALRDLIGNPGWATPAEIQRKALAIIGTEEENHD